MSDVTSVSTEAKGTPALGSSGHTETTIELPSLLGMGWREYGALIVSLGAILVAPWFTALFFPPASSIAGTAVILLAAICIRFWSGKPKRSEFGLQTGGAGAGARNTIAFYLQDPTTWVLLFGIYTMLTNFWAASIESSLQYTIPEFAGVLLFVLLYQQGKRLAPWLTFAVFIAGVAIFIVGIGSGTGLDWFSQADGIYQHHDLASVFEYHNTFGAFELAVSLLALVAGLSYKRWWTNIFAAATFTIAMAGVFGSYSREIWVMAPIGYLLALILLGWIRRSYAPILTSIVLLVLGGISTLLTLDALGKISQMRTLAAQKTVAALAQSNTLHGDVLRDVILIAVVAVAAGFGVPLFTRWLSARRVTRLQGLGAAAVVLVAVIAVVYKYRHHLLSGTTSAATRLQSISLNSVSLQERFYYYKNAIAMWLNQPIFGAGGNTWSTKFQAFETNPYWSRQVHSVFFDQLLNGGIIGLLLWLAMLVFILIHVVRAIRAQADASHKLLALGFLLAAGAMLAHGLFDFDFAFGYIQFMFFALLGLAAGTAVYRPAVPGAIASQVDTSAARAPSSAAKERAQRDQQQRGQRRKVLQRFGIAGTLVITAVTVVMGISVSVAGSIDQQISAAGQSLATDQGALQIGTWFAPYDASLELALAQYDLSTAQSTKQQALASAAVAPLDAGAGYATWSPSDLGRAAVLAYQMGNLPQALQWAQEAYRDAPFNSVAAGNVMGIAMWTGASELKSDHAAGVALEQQVVTTFRTFIARKNAVDLTLFPDAYAVYENTSMQVYLGTADYLLGHYAESIKVLNPLINKGEDQAAVELYMIDMVLDGRALHDVTAGDKTFYKAIEASPAEREEYSYLAAAGPAASAKAPIKVVVSGNGGKAAGKQGSAAKGSGKH